MNTSRRYIYFLIILLIVIGLKFIFRTENLEVFQFLLLPVKIVLDIITTSNSNLIPNEGYFYSDFNILISKSCAGYNFFLIAFASFSYVLIKYKLKKINTFNLIPLGLLLAYVITLLANISRILLSIAGQNIADHFMLQRPHLLLHELIGTFVYLFFLLTSYLVLDYILKKYSYEKST